MEIAENIFRQYCDESGMDQDDIKAAVWYPAGMIEYTEWMLERGDTKKPKVISKFLRDFGIFISEETYEALGDGNFHTYQWGPHVSIDKLYQEFRKTTSGI